MAITPAGVRELAAAGHSIYIEQGAGTGCSIPDEAFVLSLIHI